MSDKKQQAVKKFEVDVYSEEWPYSDVFTPEQGFAHPEFTEDIELHLPAIKPSDLFTPSEVDQEIILVESPVPRTLSNALSFLAGVTLTAIVVLALYNPQPHEPAPDDALVLLRELNQQFEIQSAMVELKASSTSPYSLLDGPELIAKLRSSETHTDKQLWLEASRRKDERVTIALLELLNGREEHTQARALLALTSGFHADQTLVFKEIVSGFQKGFSPFTRAYATKVLFRNYGERARRFLQSRVLVEDNSFVLAITTHLLQSPESSTKSELPVEASTL